MRIFVAGCILFPVCTILAQPIAFISNPPGPASVIDLAAKRVLASIELHSKAGEGMSISPDGRRLYVTEDDGLAVVDVTSYAVEHIYLGAPARDVAVSPDGRKVYLQVSSPETTKLLVIDAATGRTLSTIPVALFGWRLIFAPDGRRLYHFEYNASSYRLTVIDTTIDQIVDQIDGTGRYAGGGAISPDGSYALVGMCGNLEAIETATLHKVRDIGLSQEDCAGAIAVSWDGTRAYVTGETLLDTIEIVDLKAFRTIGSIEGPVCGEDDLAITQDGRTLWALGYHCLSEVDLASNQVSNLWKDLPGYWRIALPPDPPTLADVPLRNGAAFGPRVARGSLASVFGTGLARGVQSATALPLPNTLLDTAVKINGAPAPLAFVSAGQINLQIPWEAPPGPAVLQVTRGSYSSETRTIMIDDIAPGIFVIDASGGWGVTHADSGRLVTGQDPAIAGEVIKIFATGLGPLKEPVASGVAPGRAIETVSPAQVTLGAVTAETMYAGASPEYPGFYQINARVAPNTPHGAVVPVVVTASGTQSNVVNASVR